MRSRVDSPFGRREKPGAPAGVAVQPSGAPGPPVRRSPLARTASVAWREAPVTTADPKGARKRTSAWVAPAGGVSRRRVVGRTAALSCSLWNTGMGTAAEPAAAQSAPRQRTSATALPSVAMPSKASSYGQPGAMGTTWVRPLLVAAASPSSSFFRNPSATPSRAARRSPAQIGATWPKAAHRAGRGTPTGSR